jgi:HAAS
MIERYLAELERRLPRRGRRRILAELRDHLRSSAEVYGEDEAIRRFGPPEEVARSFRREANLGRFALAAAIMTMLPTFYGLPENQLPPAPWPDGEMPFGLEWKRDAVLVLAALAAGALLSGRRRVTMFGLACTAASSALAVILTIEWANAVPGTPAWLALAGLVPGSLALGGLASYRAAAPRKHARAWVFVTDRQAFLRPARSACIPPRIVPIPSKQ